MSKSKEEYIYHFQLKPDDYVNQKKELDEILLIKHEQRVFIESSKKSK